MASLTKELAAEVTFLVQLQVHSSGAPPVPCISWHDQLTCLPNLCCAQQAQHTFWTTLLQRKHVGVMFEVCVGVTSVDRSELQDYCGIVGNMTMAQHLHTKLWLSDQDGTIYKPSASFACAASTPQILFATHNRSSIPTKISVPLSIDITVTIGAREAARTGAQGLPKRKTSSGWINAKVRLSLQPLQTFEARTFCALSFWLFM